MSVDRTTFLAEFPEFTNIAPTAIDRRLAQSTLALNSDKLGMWYDELCFLWSAHYLYLRFDVGTGLDTNGLNDQENQGVTTSQSASTNGLSSSTSVTSLVSGENVINADFARTQYGLEFLSLLRQALPPAMLCS